MKLFSQVWRKRVFLAVAGFVALESVGNAYDYFVYPLITYLFGKKIWLSFLVLCITAIILNYLLVLAYDYFKKDLFGFESIKEFKENNKEGKKGILYKIISWGRVPAFLALSIYDPFLAVLYERKTTDFSGFSRRDYYVLLVSTVFSCLVWSALWSPLVFLL